MKLLRSCLLAAVAASILGACGQTSQAPSQTPIQVRDAWSPALPNQMTAVYFEITANEADVLLGGSSPIAQTAEMHETSEEDGMMRMRPLERLSLEAGTTVRFERGGKHFMLMGLRRPLTPGEKFPMTLRFAKAGEIPITVEARAPGEGMP